MILPSVAPDAAKLPEASRLTIAFAVLASVASLPSVTSVPLVYVAVMWPPFVSLTVSVVLSLPTKFKLAPPVVLLALKS